MSETFSVNDQLLDVLNFEGQFPVIFPYLGQFGQAHLALFATFFSTARARRLAQNEAPQFWFQDLRNFRGKPGKHIISKNYAAHTGLKLRTLVGGVSIHHAHNRQIAKRSI